ncbi:unnamed protein product [Effrenium voratum]|nr:unnamed protein product [Effrenium voratum]
MRLLMREGWLTGRRPGRPGVAWPSRARRPFTSGRSWLTTGAATLGAVCAQSLVLLPARLARANEAPDVYSKAELALLNVKELKKLCRQRKLKVTGNKADLVKRLDQFMAGLKQAAMPESETPESDEMPEPDEPEPEVGYTKAQREMLRFSLKELQELCKERGLASEGAKVDLVKRLALRQAEEAEAEAEAEQSQLPDGRSHLTKEDRFIQAIKGDDVDVKALEEIFNMPMPQPGEVVTGTVTSLVEWGAFVELHSSGWLGLIHISEISDVFVENIEDYICPGQKVEALVIQSQMDRVDRISLSIRRLKDMAKYDPQALASMQAMPTQARPNYVREEDLVALQERVTALEAIIIEMGHGQALRDARWDASSSARRSRVSELNDVLAEPEPVEPEETSPSTAELREKSAIDNILKSLFEGSEDAADGDDSDLENMEPGATRLPA